MSQTELQQLEMRLEILNGSQAALFNAVKALMAVNGFDPSFAALLSGSLEHSRSTLLGSSASDAYIEGFEHSAALLLEQATGNPQSSC